MRMEKEGGGGELLYLPNQEISRVSAGTATPHAASSLRTGGGACR